MKKAALGLLLSALCSLPAFAGSATVEATSARDAYEITVTTAPDPQNEEAFICTAVLKNVSTDEVISTSNIVFKADETAQMEWKGDNDSFRLSLSSDSGRNEARAVCEYSVQGEVVFAPTLVFELQ